MFLKLLSVSGVGTKLALAILSAMPLRDLSLAIVTGDAATLSRAPGVGKKTAQRIALELKEKVTESEFESVPASGASLSPVQEDAAVEALAALQALGYTPVEASRALAGARAERFRQRAGAPCASRHGGAVTETALAGDAREGFPFPPKPIWRAIRPLPKNAPYSEGRFDEPYRLCRGTENTTG